MKLGPARNGLDVVTISGPLHIYSPPCRQYTWHSHSAESRREMRAKMSRSKAVELNVNEAMYDPQSTRWVPPLQRPPIMTKDPPGSHNCHIACKDILPIYSSRRGGEGRKGKLVLCGRTDLDLDLRVGGG